MTPAGNGHPPGRGASGKPLVVAAAVLVVFAAALLVWLLPRHRTPPAASEPAPRTEATAAGPAAIPAIPRAPAAVRRADVARAGSAPSAAPIPSVDLFAGAPELLDMAHRVVMRKDMLSVTKLKEIYEFAKEHPGDARPQLLMAADSVNHGWHEFAIGHYLKAFAADPRARGDARMLEDLVHAAGSEHYGKKAGDALATIYGSGAAPALYAAADEATSRGDTARAERLVSIAATVEAAAPPGP